MNGCMSIIKDLPLHYTKKNVKCHKWLYKYYKGSTIVLYWMLIVTNGCMSITKYLSLYYTEC
jgi:hypothetical protein